MRVAEELRARTAELRAALGAAASSDAAELAQQLAVLAIVQRAAGLTPAMPPQLAGTAQGSRVWQAWSELMQSSQFAAWLEKHCRAMGPGEDRPYFAAELALAHLGEHTLRQARGIYYTPRVLVEYLVASVDRLLVDRLGVADGLASLAHPHAPLALVDPACGSGLFFDSVLRRCMPLVAAANEDPEALSRRLVGFELVPAAAESARWILAHRFGRGAAPTIFDASPLQPAATELLDHARGPSGALVIVGNPPYASFGRANRDPWLLDLMRTYWEGLNEQKHNLHDDALKFLRWSEWQIERAGRGILALVLNHAFLDGLTHRRLRESLLTNFQELYLVDLHGSALRKARAAERRAGQAQRDENVFAIRPGIALLLAVRDGTHRACRVHHAERRGLRAEKLAWLGERNVTNTEWQPIEARPPQWRLVPTPKMTAEQQAYAEWPRIDSIFIQYVSGVQTKNDKRFVAFTRESLARQIRASLDPPPRGWLLPALDDVLDETALRPYMVAPWDLRWIYYDPQQLGRARFPVMRHMLQDNLGLVFMRQSTNAAYDHCLVTKELVSDRVFYSGHGAPYLAPLRCDDGAGAASNLYREFCDRLAERTGLRFAEAADPGGSRERQFGPREVLAYVYAIMHTATYRKRYFELLNRDFPRVPWPGDADQFQALAEVGEQLIAAHLPPLPPPQSECHEPFWRIERRYPRYVAESRTVAINEQTMLHDVSEAAWNLRIGGYRVLARWLEQRRGRSLGPDERAHFQWMAQAADATIRLAAEADELLRRTETPSHHLS